MTRIRQSGLDLVLLTGIVVASIVLVSESLPVATGKHLKAARTYSVIRAQLSMPRAGAKSIPPATKRLTTPPKPAIRLTPEQRRQLTEEIKRQWAAKQGSSKPAKKSR